MEREYDKKKFTKRFAADIGGTDKRKAVEKMTNHEQLPCDTCADRHSCEGACHVLNSWLRKDPKCHIRPRATELVVDPLDLTIISDAAQADGTRLSWQEIAKSTVGYLDIESIPYLSKIEKLILFHIKTEGLTLREIADIYRVSAATIFRIFWEAASKLRENNELENT